MPREKGLGRHRKEKALASKLDQLRVMTTVVARTGDLGAVACLEPVDYDAVETAFLPPVRALLRLARGQGHLAPFFRRAFLTALPRMSPPQPRLQKGEPSAPRCRRQVQGR